MILYFYKHSLVTSLTVSLLKNVSGILVVEIQMWVGLTGSMCLQKNNCTRPFIRPLKGTVYPAIEAIHPRLVNFKQDIDSRNWAHEFVCLISRKDEGNKKCKSSSFCPAMYSHAPCALGHRAVLSRLNDNTATIPSTLLRFRGV